MAYYNRKKQILETLKGFEKIYANKYNFEVIIVDDNSNKNNCLIKYIKYFSFPISLIVIDDEEKGNIINPCIAYNKGFLQAKGDFIIIQNPEILHCGNILEFIHNNINLIQNNYITFPVFSSPSFKHNNILYNINKNYFKNFIKKINYKDFDFDYKYYIEKYPEFKFMNKIQAEKNYLEKEIKNNKVCNKHNIFYRKKIIYDWKGWYNHHIYNPRNLHFLSLISKNNLRKIGGFCSKFKYGLWYDDDDFLFRIKKITNVICLDSKKYFGIHQYHIGGSDEQHTYKNFVKLKKLNKNIFDYNIKNNIVYCPPYEF